MPKEPSFLSQPEPWDLVAEGYATTTMPMFRPYAEVAIESLGVSATGKVLDVACGPGTATLLLAKKACEVHAIDFSAEMLAILDEKIKIEKHLNIYPQFGDGQAMPFKDESFDAAVSMFGLMFFPDRYKGFSELYRILRAHGRIAVTSWAPVSQSPAMQIMFGALHVINPDLPEPKMAIDSLENPEQFEKEMQEAGFHQIKVQRVRKEFPVVSVADFWSAMVTGSAPIRMMKQVMSAQLWQEKERLALAYLEKELSHEPEALCSDAWLGTGVK
ncbi:MAG: methyltransferase domain-containing protein [Mariprofundaceae bacterium]|nr:methyltransferase domain-containing protein [Mariprofundaceae bacterium]